MATGFLVLAVVAGGAWVMYGLSPEPTGKAIYVRYKQPTPLASVTGELVGKGIVRNARLFEEAAGLKGLKTVKRGTYRLHPGMGWQEVVASLQKPVRQEVMIPPGWWIARVAKRLEAKGVCAAGEYIEEARHPEKFQSDVTFQLPKGSLEGYLFPDTYDLPPMLGADETIRRQLKAFEEKVVKPLGTQNLERAVTIASMVELEAAKDVERPVIAGVIENRLARKQNLEIDATVLYALQEWKNLGPGVVRTVKSPYNTYLHPGLPPGPIGSPGKASIEAALNPSRHGYFFYVAKPDRTHIFSATYAEHLSAIRVARKEWTEAKEKA